MLRDNGAVLLAVAAVGAATAAAYLLLNKQKVGPREDVKNFHFLRPFPERGVDLLYVN